MVERVYHRVLIALRSFLRRGTVEQELDEELQFHLDQMQESAVTRGDDQSDARWGARRHMGSVDAVKEACRDMRTLRLVEHFLADLRFGARLLVRGPGFTTVAVLSLALGIGSSSAIVSVINAIVLRSLPIADPQELHIAQAMEPNEVEQLFPYPVVARAAELLAGRAQVAAQSSVESVLIATREGGEASPPEAAQLQLVAGDFFGTLRQRAQIGRLLGPDDNRTLGQHPVAVISDRYWSRRFGRSGRVLETELIINGSSMAVVGVAAREFFGTTVDTETPDVWAPAAMQAALRFAGGYDRSGGDLLKPWPSQPEIAWLRVMIRTPAAGAPAAAEAMTLARQRESPPGVRDAEAVPVTLVPGSRGFSPMRSELTTPLIVLLLAVGLLLAIACANIASLLLARATTRTREMAIRLSIGAGRGRLIRQLLTESLLLASVGGVLGLLLASWGSTALLTILTHGKPVSSIDVRPDWRVIGLTFATSMATALAFGLLPALRGTRVPLADSLKAQARSVIGAAGHGGRVPLGKVLIAGQMAVAILLLLGAALFVQSFQALVHVDVGYDRGHVLVARIDARSSGYTVADRPALYTRVIETLGRLPGVVAVSASATMFSGRNRGAFSIEGYTPTRGEQMNTLKEWVTSDYFRTVGLAITQGRGFGPEDSANSRRVSVINETMARRYFRDQNPIGKRLTWGTSDFDRDGFEIVGVVEDARYDDVRAESLNMAYILVEQSERFVGNVEVRAAGNPTALANAVRNALRESEPRLAVGTIETLDTRVARSIGVDRLLAWLTMAFAAAALGLVCLGLYGTISYAVRRRTAELGIRIALGADRGAVQWLIVREALLLVLLGGAIGLPLAFLAARAVGSLLYATAPSDPVAYGTAVGVLVVVSAFAAYLPARRASRLDPMIALRTE
jgi:predicted permease